MKFALLIATVSAIRVSAEDKPCVSMAESNQVFDMIDTNHNGQVSKKELTKAVKGWLAQHPEHQPSKKEVAMFKNQAKKDAGADHTLSKAEFNNLANQVCAYAESQ